jgi:hypothetical protein
MPADLPTLQRSPMPRQRLSSTAVMERGAETAGSIRLDACELHHLGPLLGFVGDELAEVGGRPDEHRAAHVRKPRLQLRVGEGRVDLRVELRNDFGGRSLWCADAIPCARLVIGHELTHGRVPGSASERVAAVTASARCLPALIYPIDETVVGNMTWTCPASRSFR